MLISELSFPHLQTEREAQLTRDLERRRVALERLDDQARSRRSFVEQTRRSFVGEQTGARLARPG